MSGDRFFNPGDNLACPTGGISMWNSLQGHRDVRTRMTTSDAYMVKIDGIKTQVDQIVRVTMVYLHAIS